MCFVRVSSCCGCADLITGTKIIAAVYVAWAVLVLILYEAARFQYPSGASILFFLIVFAHIALAVGVHSSWRKLI